MTWNWKHKDWPNFTFDQALIRDLHDEYLHQSGILKGYLEPLSAIKKNDLVTEILSEEALITSEIEGEFLHRQSIRSSIINSFGLNHELKNLPQKEKNIAKAITQVHHSLGKRISIPMINSWHKNLLNQKIGKESLGKFRSGPVYIISGGSKDREIHFEAPPHEDLTLEMNRFMSWLNEPAKSALSKTAVSHLYFESIHPYADGNGRIGRLLVEKILMEDLGFAPLLYLSWTINNRKSDYYNFLSECSKRIEITPWVEYFSEVILMSMSATIAKIRSIIEKVKIYDEFSESLNTRQKKVIDKVFGVSPDVFDGGLSAENYISMTKCSRATATRDLSALVQFNIFRKKGSLKHTRYFLQKEIESLIVVQK